MGGPSRKIRHRMKRVKLDFGRSRQTAHLDDRSMYQCTEAAARPAVVLDLMRERRESVSIIVSSVTTVNATTTGPEFVSRGLNTNGTLQSLTGYTLLAGSPGHEQMAVFRASGAVPGEWS